MKNHIEKILLLFLIVIACWLHHFFSLQISWIISDESDGSFTELSPGETKDNFDALDLKEGQSMQYEAYLIIKAVDYDRDFDKVIKIRAEVSTYLHKITP